MNYYIDNLEDAKLNIMLTEGISREVLEEQIKLSEIIIEEIISEEMCVRN